MNITPLILWNEKDENLWNYSMLVLKILYHLFNLSVFLCRSMQVSVRLPFRLSVHSPALLSVSSSFLIFVALTETAFQLMVATNCEWKWYEINGAVLLSVHLSARLLTLITSSLSPHCSSCSRASMRERFMPTNWMCRFFTVSPIAHGARRCQKSQQRW